MDRLVGSPTPIGLGRPYSPGGFPGEVRVSIPGQGREIFKISALLLVVSPWAVGGCLGWLLYLQTKILENAKLSVS